MLITPRKQPIKQYAAALRRNQTRGELAIKGLKWWGFKAQQPIGGYVPDYYSAGLMAAVEVVGSVHDLKAVKIRDKRKKAHLRARGIYTIYIKDAAAQQRPIFTICEVVAVAATWRGLTYAWTVIKNCIV